MTKNIGKNDKLIRLIIAIVIFILIYLGKITDNTTQIILLVVAFIAALTSLMNYCLLYQLIGFNTCKKNK